MNNIKSNHYWKIAYWILFACWLLGAVLYMARYNGGFLTNYLSDVTFPPWFYIYIRGLQTENQVIPNLIFFKKWFGLTCERASISILIAGVVSEFKTLIWPTGIISGTFDPYDILSYAFGLSICYLIDKFA
jgi:hypothetical protein